VNHAKKEITLFSEKLKLCVYSIPQFLYSFCLHPYFKGLALAALVLHVLLTYLIIYLT